MATLKWARKTLCLTLSLTLAASALPAEVWAQSARNAQELLAGSKRNVQTRGKNVMSTTLKRRPARPIIRTGPAEPAQPQEPLFPQPEFVNIPGVGGMPLLTDLNGRPNMSIAQVPEEFSCPLFENRPYENLTQAIDSLTQAMNATAPECRTSGSPGLPGQQNQGPAVTEIVQENSKALRDAITQLNNFMQNPADAYSNTAVMEQNITAAITAATNLGGLLKNNALLNPRCGRDTMGAGKMLLAVNDVLNSLAPFALLAVAVNPALGAAMKFAITGGAIATSTVSGVAKMIENASMDMKNPENRKAVLKNTCAYTKVARKVRFMKLAQSGQITKISEELNKNIIAYEARFSRKSAELEEMVQYKESIERQATEIETQMRRDALDLAALEAQIKEAGGNDELVCLTAQEMVRQSAAADSNAMIFPMTIVLNLNQAMETSETEMNAQLAGIKNLNDVSRRRISALAPRVAADELPAIKYCADTARSWVASLRQMLKITGQMVNAERAEVETELSVNPEYSQFAKQSRQLRNEKTTVNRVTSVMKELAKDNSVINRSELDQSMDGLKHALFGTRGTWTLGKSPIRSWLEHTASLHSVRVSSFHQNLEELKAQAWYMTQTGQMRVNARQSMSERDRQMFEDFNVSKSLSNINAQTIPEGTRQHEIACQILESAWLDWTSAIDHLGATEFMCDMIDPYLDNKVESTLVSYCRGDIGLDGRQRVASTIQRMKSELITPRGLRMNNMSSRDWALLIGQKMQNLSCPMPPVAVMQQ